MMKELKPMYVSQKSFYNKAFIKEDEYYITLYSFGTRVAVYDKVSKKFYVYGWFSPTTSMHINEFRNQLGFQNKLSKQDMIEMSQEN